MKLVQLLAKELREWPEIDECSDPILFITQDSSGTIFSWNDNGELKFVNGQWYMQGTIPFDEVIFDGSETCSDCSSAIVREDQWQAERKKMNKPKWIRHRGGKCPVAGGTEVETRHRDGKTYSPHFHTKNSRSGVAMNAVWEHKGDALDIMAYRVIEETKDQEIEKVKDTNIGTLSITLDSNDVFKPMIASMKDIALEWGQIESPLKWRDEIIELEAYEEEFRREREKLIRKLESEGFKLIDHINCNLDKIDQTLDNSSDMSDWRNWRAGDTVECLVVPGKHTGYYFSGENYNIRCVDLDDEGTSSEVDIYCAEGFSLWCPSSSFKFIRRP